MTIFPEDETLGSLTGPEQRLVAAARAGEILMLGPDEAIRAAVVRALACTAVDDWPVAAAGVRVIGGRIDGRLALAERTLRRPLWIDDAEIPGGVDLTASRTRLLSFEKSRISEGFLGSDVRIEGSLVLHDAMLKGVCDIVGATITGQFAANGATFDNPGGQAIYGQSSTIASMFLHNATLRGTCDINSATITGQFSANGATFDNPGGQAIHAQSSTIAGMFLNTATLKGVCDIAGATITGQFSANGATFDNPGGQAIHAQSSTIADMFLDTATLKGVCDIAGATIAGQFAANGATFDNPGGQAIHAQSSTIADMFLDTATLKGVCDISGATIAGQFAADGATFDNPDGHAIRADLARIGAWIMRPGPTGAGDAPQPTRLCGTLLLFRATIERHFEISGADLAYRRTALDVSGIDASGLFFIGEDTRIAGGVDLAAASIRGRLDLTGSRITSAAQAGDREKPPPRLADDPAAFTALDLSEARIDHLVMPATVETRPRGIVDLSRARVGTLTDYAAAWPKAADRKARACKDRFRDGAGRDADHLVLDGLEYEHLDNPDGLPPGERAGPRRLARIRRDWLHAQSCEDVFDRLRPQPWRHLAKILAAQGYEEEARRIAIERRVAQRHASGTGRLARGLSWLLHRLADYGFNPWKALGWSGGVIAACALVYAVAAGSCTSAAPVCADETVFIRTTAADFVPAVSDIGEAQKKLAATYPAFDPLAYSLDVFLPFFDIGTERFWRVNTTTGWGVALYWFTVLEQIAGALLVSLVVTGFTGLLTRGEA